MFEGNNEGNTEGTTPPMGERHTYNEFDRVQGEAVIKAANEVASLKADLEELQAQRAFYVKESNEWREKWGRAATLFEASLEEDGVDTDDLNENTRALVELFGIEFTKEVEVRVTVTYSGTVTIPKNADVYDVQSGLDYYDSLDLELEGNNVGSISYDDFDIEEL